MTIIVGIISFMIFQITIICFFVFIISYNGNIFVKPGGAVPSNTQTTTNSIPSESTPVDSRPPDPKPAEPRPEPSVSEGSNPTYTIPQRFTPGGLKLPELNIPSNSDYRSLLDLSCIELKNLQQLVANYELEIYMLNKLIGLQRERDGLRTVLSDLIQNACSSPADRNELASAIADYPREAASSIEVLTPVADPSVVPEISVSGVKPQPVKIVTQPEKPVRQESVPVESVSVSSTVVYTPKESQITQTEPVQSKEPKESQPKEVPKETQDRAVQAKPTPKESQEKAVQAKPAPKETQEKGLQAKAAPKETQDKTVQSKPPPKEILDKAVQSKPPHKEILDKAVQAKPVPSETHDREVLVKPVPKEIQEKLVQAKPALKEIQDKAVQAKASPEEGQTREPQPRSASPAASSIKSAPSPGPKVLVPAKADVIPDARAVAPPPKQAASPPLKAAVPKQVADSPKSPVSKHVPASVTLKGVPKPVQVRETPMEEHKDSQVKPVQSVENPVKGDTLIQAAAGAKLALPKAPVAKESTFTPAKSAQPKEIQLKELSMDVTKAPVTKESTFTPAKSAQPKEIQLKELSMDVTKAPVTKESTFTPAKSAQPKEIQLKELSMDVTKAPVTKESTFTPAKSAQPKEIQLKELSMDVTKAAQPKAAQPKQTTTEAVKTKQSEPQPTKQTTQSQSVKQSHQPVSSESTKSEFIKSEQTKTEAIKTVPTKDETVTPDPVKSEPVKKEPLKTQSSKSEPIKAETAIPDLVKPEITQLIRTGPSESQPSKTEDGSSNLRGQGSSEITLEVTVQAQKESEIDIKTPVLCAFSTPTPDKSVGIDNTALSELKGLSERLDGLSSICTETSQSYDSINSSSDSYSSDDSRSRTDLSDIRSIISHKDEFDIVKDATIDGKIEKSNELASLSTSVYFELDESLGTYESKLEEPLERERKVSSQPLPEKAFSSISEQESDQFTDSEAFCTTLKPALTHTEFTLAPGSDDTSKSEQDVKLVDETSPLIQSSQPETESVAQQPEGESETKGVCEAHEAGDATSSEHDKVADLSVTISYVESEEAGDATNSEEVEETHSVTLTVSVTQPSEDESDSKESGDEALTVASEPEYMSEDQSDSKGGEEAVAVTQEAETKSGEESDKVSATLTPVSESTPVMTTPTAEPVIAVEQQEDKVEEQQLDADQSQPLDSSLSVVEQQEDKVEEQQLDADQSQPLDSADADQHDVEHQSIAYSEPVVPPEPPESASPPEPPESASPPEPPESASPPEPPESVVSLEQQTERSVTVTEEPGQPSVPEDDEHQEDQPGLLATSIPCESVTASLDADQVSEELKETDMQALGEHMLVSTLSTGGEDSLESTLTTVVSDSIDIVDSEDDADSKESGDEALTVASEPEYMSEDQSDSKGGEEAVAVTQEAETKSGDESDKVCATLTPVSESTPVMTTPTAEPVIAVEQQEDKVEEQQLDADQSQPLDSSLSVVEQQEDKVEEQQLDADQSQPLDSSLSVVEQQEDKVEEQQLDADQSQPLDSSLSVVEQQEDKVEEQQLDADQSQPLDSSLSVVEQQEDKVEEQQLDADQSQPLDSSLSVVEQQEDKVEEQQLDADQSQPLDSADADQHDVEHQSIAYSEPVVPPEPPESASPPELPESASTPELPESASPPEPPESASPPEPPESVVSLEQQTERSVTVTEEPGQPSVPEDDEHQEDQPGLLATSIPCESVTASLDADQVSEELKETDMQALGEHMLVSTLSTGGEDSLESTLTTVVSDSIDIVDSEDDADSKDVHDSYDVVDSTDVADDTDSVDCKVIADDTVLVDATSTGHVAKSTDTGTDIAEELTSPEATYITSVPDAAESTKLSDIKLYVSDPYDASNYVEMDTSGFNLTESGNVASYQIAGGVNCVKFIFDDVLMWQHDPNQRGGKYPKSLVYDRNTDILVLKFDGLDITYEKDDKGDWVFSEMDTSASSESVDKSGQAPGAEASVGQLASDLSSQSTEEATSSLPEASNVETSLSETPTEVVTPSITDENAEKSSYSSPPASAELPALLVLESTAEIQQSSPQLETYVSEVTTPADESSTVTDPETQIQPAPEVTGPSEQEAQPHLSSVSDPGSEATSEASPEPVPEVSPTLSPDDTPEATLEATPESISAATPDPSHVVTPTLTSEVASQSASESTPEPKSESTSEPESEKTNVDKQQPAEQVTTPAEPSSEQQQPAEQVTTPAEPSSEQQPAPLEAKEESSKPPDDSKPAEPTGPSPSIQDSKESAPEVVTPPDSGSTDAKPAEASDDSHNFTLVIDATDHDSTKYEVNVRDANITEYTMKNGNKCVEVQFNGKQIWKFDSSDSSAKYPASMKYDKKRQRVRINFGTEIESFSTKS